MEEVHIVADSERNIWCGRGKTSCSVLDTSFVCENQRKKLLTPYSNSLSKPLVDFFFNVLLTVHLSIILVIDQNNTQILVL